MSESMIERVAMALEPKCRAFGKGDMPMAIAREFARAAIEAMRNPSHDMMGAMFEAMFEEKYDGTTAPMMGAGFEAAIDAALQD